MRQRPPLILMEQMIMLLVFALAAALCLQAFVKSDGISKRSEARDRAVILCQNVAETLRGSGGSVDEAAKEAAEKLEYHCEGAALWQEFDEVWTPVDSGIYRLEAEGISTDVPGLASACISVRKVYDTEREPETLFALTTAWQKER